MTNAMQNLLQALNLQLLHRTHKNRHTQGSLFDEKWWWASFSLFYSFQESPSCLKLAGMSNSLESEECQELEEFRRSFWNFFQECEGAEFLAPAQEKEFPAKEFPAKTLGQRCLLPQLGQRAQGRCW